MGKKYFFLLALVLVLVASGCVALNHYWNTDGLLINLATEMIGIIITVFFVDRIINHREKVIWKKVEGKINNYTVVIINSTLSSIRGGLGFNGLEIFEYIGKPFETLPDLNTTDLFNFAFDKVEKEASKRIVNMRDEDWNTLFTNFNNINDSIKRILDLYGSKISPDYFELLIELQDDFRYQRMIFLTWQDLLFSKKAEEKIEEFKESAYRKLCENIKKIHNTAYRLYSTIDHE
jgi:hypothetical protein